MGCGPAIVFFIVFKHREVDYPQWFPYVFKQAIIFTKFTVTDFYAQSADGAQLEAVWTAPERRGKGLATRALTDLSARLLRRLPRVVLGVATVNTPAVRLYERVGFQSAGPLRLVSY